MHSKLIYLTDIHYSDTNPRSWKADYSATLLNSLKYIFDYARLNKIHNVLHGGDLGHRFNWDSVMLTDFSRLRKEYQDIKFYTIIGNHDIPGRNISSLDGTGIGILRDYKQNVLEIVNPGHTLDPLVLGSYNIYGFHSDWDQTNLLLTNKLKINFQPGINIALIHAPIGAETTPWTRGVKDLDIPGFDFCLFGDIHPGWTPYKCPSGGWLLNPGSFGRRNINDSDRVTSAYVISDNQFTLLKVPEPPKEELFNLRGHVAPINKEYLEDMTKIRVLNNESLQDIIQKKSKELGVDKSGTERLLLELESKGE
jgi:DNA repair exonuclease SbcCD nuclease subunit